MKSKTASSCSGREQISATKQLQGEVESNSMAAAAAAAAAGTGAEQANLQVREALPRCQQAQATKTLMQQLAMVLRTGGRANWQVRTGAPGH
jgi:hypothetical protein